MSVFRTKLFMQHFRSLFLFLLTILPYCFSSYKRRISSKRCASLLEAPHFQMQLLLETSRFFNSNALFDFLIPPACLCWKCLVIITSKSITHFTEKAACFICPYFTQRAMILLSRYYVARGETKWIMLKSRHFCYRAYFFHKENLIR